MNYALASAAVAALLVGFLAGLLTFKRSMRWYPGCGAILTCPHNCGGYPGRGRPPGVGLGDANQRRSQVLDGPGTDKEQR